MNRKFSWKALCLSAVLCLAAVSPVSAEGFLRVELNTSHYMAMPSPIQRIAVGNPEIATVVQIPGSDSEFLIVAHRTGTTSLFIWSAYGERFEYIVGVSPEDRGQAKLIESTIGLPDVRVKLVDGKVLLTGTVRDQYERNYAVQTARLYVKSMGNSSLSVGSNVNMGLETQKADSAESLRVGGAASEGDGNVIDLLHMRYPAQIRLEAQVIAINPEEKKNLGLQYTGALSSGDDFSSAYSGVFLGGESYKSGGGATPYRNDINAVLQALVTQSKAKILSRPSITTMSGEAAVIQVGGEIPYTTRDRDGIARTEYKDYGIILQFRPVVDAENRIVSSIHAEISKPNGETVDGQPVLERRRTDSVVTVSPGTTMVIGGLMDSSESKTVSKIPFLGDIPVIGEFFKYTATTKDKQELAVLITPYLVDENNLSSTRMSRDMKEYYEKGQAEHLEKEIVDVNEPPAAEEEAKPEQDDGSILKKYLKRYADGEKK